MQRDPEDLVARYLEDPRPDLKDLIMVEYATLVERVARKFCGLEPFEDLVQVGFIGLLNALTKYDPDAGVRFNLRLWRFLKSALDFVPWRDDYVFMQTQGYWILANWMLHEATGEPRYRKLALESSEATLGRQTVARYRTIPWKPSGCSCGCGRRPARHGSWGMWTRCSNSSPSSN